MKAEDVEKLVSASRDRPRPEDPDRPVTNQYGIVETPLSLADCGCPTYWINKSANVGRGMWEAQHGVRCLRIPIRRREAIEHSRSKT